jgi:site-specific recombinase XerD
MDYEVRASWLLKWEKRLKKNKKPETIEQYLILLDNYLSFQDCNPIFSKNRVEEFLWKLRVDGRSPYTIRTYFYYLKSFFNDFQEVFPFTKFEVPNISLGKPPIIEFEDFKKIDKAARTLGNISQKLRNIALVRLAFDARLKRRELHSLSISDIELVEGGEGGGYVFIRGPDGVDKRRFGRGAGRALGVWINHRTRKRVHIGFREYFGGSDADPCPLWSDGRTGGRLSPRALNSVLKKLSQHAGLSVSGFGALRHGKSQYIKERKLKLEQEKIRSEDTTDTALVQSVENKEVVVSTEGLDSSSKRLEELLEIIGVQKRNR